MEEFHTPIPPDINTVTGRATRPSSSSRSVEPGIIIERMQYKHIFRAHKTYMNAFATDSLQRYAQDTPDSNRAMTKFLQSTMMRGKILSLVRKKAAYAINDGVSWVSIRPAQNAPPDHPPTPTDKLLDRIEGFWSSFFGKLKSPEQKNRGKEIRSRMSPIFAELGDRVKDMVWLSDLCTDPSYQGQGYGSALVRFVVTYAESQHRACILGTVERNVAFYESFGFVAIGQLWVGMDNPTYDGKPVSVRIMVRESSQAKC